MVPGKDWRGLIRVDLKTWRRRVLQPRRQRWVIQHGGRRRCRRVIKHRRRNRNGVMVSYPWQLRRGTDDRGRLRSFDGAAGQSW
jgi:hypothetical protein